MPLALTDYSGFRPCGTTVHIHDNCHYARGWAAHPEILAGIDLIDALYRAELQRREVGEPQAVHFCHLCYPELYRATSRNPAVMSA